MENIQFWIFLVVGLGISLYGLLVKSKTDNLKTTGVKTKGIIFDQDHESQFSIGSGINSTAKDKITVRFVTETQEWITGDIKQSFALFYTGQYKPGEEIDVYYDKSNPNNFYIDTNQSDFIGRLVIILVGLSLISYAVYNLFIRK